MPRKAVLAAVLIAAFGFPQQLLASPHTGFTAWLDEVVARLVTLWDAEADDRDAVEGLAMSTESEQPGNQPSETEPSSEEAAREEPPVTNIYPGWEPVG